MAVTSSNNLRQGSKGDDVKALQNLLNQNGYNLVVDGSFGPKTAAAVKDYQQKNGLTVDGIVGTKTWGALNSGTTTTTPPTASSSENFKPSDSTISAGQKVKDTESKKPGAFNYKDYEKSDAVKQAEASIQQHNANRPGAYQSKWQTQLDDTIYKILNREKFTYDVNGDALYQQYKDQYINQGRQAMMDTMGQAQAMTGGYGNSYAQTVGQQTYQGYLQQLNDRIPELYQIALDQYNREGQELYNQYGLFADRDEQDYGRYRDTVTDWQTDRDYLTDEARYQSETDYGRYMDDKNFQYGQYRDSVTDWQYDLNRADEDYWKKYGYDYQFSRDATEDANTAKQQAYDTVMAMLSLGVIPSADLLSAAGISASDAQAIVNKVNKNVSSDNKKGDTPTDDNPIDDDTASDDPIEPTKDDYADWDANDWESYFAQIRQSEGRAAAEEELREFASKGFIPKEYVNYAAIGARGGQMGH